jgi:hypothetical protein
MAERLCREGLVQVDQVDLRELIARTSLRTSTGMAAVSRVSMKPGATALTLMPRAASRWARDRT